MILLLLHIKLAPLFIYI